MTGSKIWARVVGGVVVELSPPLDASWVPGKDIYSPAQTWIDTTDTPGVATGWSYASGAFTAPAPSTPGPATSTSLLAYANQKQNAILAVVWSFDVGTTDAPIIVTTKLDTFGQAAMNKLATWCLMNAANVSATEPYSNVDNTGLTLTLAQAQSVVAQAAAVFSRSIAILNAVSAAIMAQPPTLTTLAQIDAAAWPSTVS